MKKFLKASSAIVGAAMVASVAHADTGISGTVRFIASMGGGGGGSDTMEFGVAEGPYISFTGSKTTDAGLTLSGGANLNETTNFNSVGDNQNASWDKTWASIAGGFGRVEVGNKGDASGLAGYAPGMAVGGYGVDGYQQQSFEAAWKTNIEVPRGLPRISYYSPNISGFMFGYSMSEAGGNSEYDVEKDGAIGATGAFATLVGLDGTSDRATITGAIDGVGAHQSSTALGFKYSVAGATVGYTSSSYSRSMTLKGATNADDNGEYSYGWAGTRLYLGYSAGALSVAYSSTTKEQDDVMAGGETLADSVNATDDAAKATRDDVNTGIGVAYNYGSGSVSLTQQTADVADGSTADTMDSTDATLMVIGVNHNLANGVNVYLEYFSGDSEIDAGEDGLDSATEIQIGTKISF